MATSTLYPLIRKIRRVFQQLRSVSDVMLEDLDINASQRAVLEALSGDEPFSVPQIAKQLSVSRQHVQVLVNELLTKQLVDSLENPAHKRSPLIRITSKGNKLFASIRKREHELLAVLQANFSSTDIAISSTTLETLQELLQSLEKESK